MIDHDVCEIQPDDIIIAYITRARVQESENDDSASGLSTKINAYMHAISIKINIRTGFVEEVDVIPKCHYFLVQSGLLDYIYILIAYITMKSVQHNIDKN